MKTHKVDVDDFAGSVYVTILASSNHKRLTVRTFVHEAVSEVLYCVTANRGRKSENATSYLTLAEAVDIYNMAE